jgi:hypothetical protein
MGSVRVEEKGDPTRASGQGPRYRYRPPVGKSRRAGMSHGLCDSAPGTMGLSRQSSGRRVWLRKCYGAVVAAPCAELVPVSSDMSITVSDPVLTYQNSRLLALGWRSSSGGSLRINKCKSVTPSEYRVLNVRTDRPG